MKYAILIPARFKSSRFPGKPLALIRGKPMIQWVYEICTKVVPSKDVFVATDSKLIEDCVAGFGGNFVRTSDTCLTGTDRIAEAAHNLDYDYFINVQGDEPMISPEDIQSVISQHKIQPKLIYNAFAPIVDERDFRSSGVPKVVFCEDNNLLYISRAAIPTNKDLKFTKANRQVCIYIFSTEHLQFFRNNPEKSVLEELEDIEILRFLEAKYTIKMVEVSGQSIAVDYPEDIERVESLLPDKN